MFIYAGRLETNKGILTLLTMWRHLPPNYELHIYGDGIYRNEIEIEAESHKNIRYYGFQKHNALLKAISRSVAAVIPSESVETFGMLIPECFSKGIPVVASALGNINQMIMESDGGVTYEIDSYVSLKQGLDQVAHSRRYYSEHAYDYYRRKLSAEENYERIQTIYGKAEHII